MREEFDIDIVVGAYVGENIYHYDHGTIRLLAYLAHWREGILNCKVHDQYAWVNVPDLAPYTFSPADVPFVQCLLRGDVSLG